jgi:hypothetical protein
MTNFDPSTPRQYLDRLFEEQKSIRSSWEYEWREIQKFILPNRGRWLTTEANRGGRRNRYIYDNTAGYAMRTLASGLMAGITSPARPWFKLTTPDPEMMKYGPVKVWLKEVEDAMGAMFANSNIYNVLSTQYEEIGGFGSGPMLLYEDKTDIMRGYSMTVGEYYQAADDRGEIGSLIREMDWSIGQMVKRFCSNPDGTVDQKKFANLSNASQSMYKRGQLSALVTIRHIIEPNNQYRPGMLGSKGKPWRSIWWEVGADQDRILDQSGFNSKPFVAPRWSVIGMDAYGQGIGSDIIGDTISLQAMTKKKARAVDKQIDPAMNLPGSMKKSGANYSLDPGVNNFVDGMGQGVNAQPAQVVQPNLSHFVMDIQEVQRRIEHGAYKDLFLMLHQMDRGQITATEIIERKAEKLIGLGPVVERLNDEMLEPMIDRAFEIMISAKDDSGGFALVPPPPQEIQDVKLGVQFISIFRQAQQQEDVTRTVSYVQNLALMAQATQDPSVMDNLDADEAAQILGNKGGVPATVVASEDQVAAKRKARADAESQVQQQMQMGQAVEAAKALSETNLNQNQNALGALMGV